MNPEIYILSASDRFNYGDLLFPIITSNELNRLGKFQIHNVAIVKSDLSRIGALPTKSYKSLLKASQSDKKPTIIVAGGEVLGANWSRLLSFIYPNFNQIYNIFSNKKILENITRSILGYEEIPYPFIPSGKFLQDNFNIIFHSVGGTGIASLPEKEVVHNTLRESIYLSVREKFTHRSIIENFTDVEVKITPDVAILMSDYYSFESNSKEKYIAFQIGHHKNEGKLDVINEQLNKLSKETGLPVYFIPIGICPGHDDIKSLKWLAGKANYPNKLIIPGDILQIMEVIASSQIFIGTSLHGIITAMSFNKPYLAINPKIKKVKYYVDCWATTPFNEISDFENIYDNSVQRINLPITILEEDNVKQKQLVKNSFSEIAGILVS